MNVKIIAIVGPTAAGKSELAVRLAKQCNGEIISADSRQVYRGLAIGSGRVKGTWRNCHSRESENPVTGCRIKFGMTPIYIYKTIPHHCIDYLLPKKRYTVIDFQQCAHKAIKNIHAREKIPFLVGGTGLYIDAVLNNTKFPSAPANPALRKKLERLSAEKLFAMLKKQDERRAATIDHHNKRRLIRALEIIEATGTPVPNLVWDRFTPNNILIIGIKKTKQELQNAIKKRIRAMLKQGLVAETKKLHAQGLSWRHIGEFGFEYRLPALFLQKKISRKELEERLIKENWRYAKRQLTWWRHNKNIRWISTLPQARALFASF